MKRTPSRTLTSMMILFAMLVSMLPVPALAAEPPDQAYDATVYVNGSSGSNDNDGKTEDTPVKSMTSAYDALYTLLAEKNLAEDPDATGRILVTGDVSFATTNGPSPKKFKNHAFTITVTGKTPDLGLNITKNYNNLGPTVYENITLTKNEKSENLTYFCANGYPLVIGENVTTVAKSNGYHFNLVGGQQETDHAGDSDLTVRSGTWRNLYVGNYKKNMTGTAKLLMSGGKVDNSLCSSYNGNHTGDMEITITGGEITGKLYGGNSYTSGSHTGNVSISISDTTVDSDLVAGGRTGLDGDIRLSLDNAKVTGAVSAQCSGSVSVELTAAEHDEIAIGSGTLAVERFTGGGTLRLGENSALSLSNVTGSTKLLLDGTPYNKAYLTAPDTTADNAFVYTASGTEQMTVTTAEGVKYWTISGGKDQAGLSLVAPEDVSVALSSGFESGSEIAPASVRTEDGQTTYFYPGLAVGNYCYKASGESFYTVKKNLIFTQEDSETGKTLQIDPGKRNGNGFEPTTTVSQYTDEVLEKLLPSSPSLWPDYAHVFETPAFTLQRETHRQTTQDEMMAFLRELDGEADSMYLYIIGQTPVYHYDVPVVVFSQTDLSGASTLEEAAALVRSNGKPTIHYQAEIHANEPAGGEGALAVIKALNGTYGDEVLNAVNVYVVPRLNGDGANPYQRANVAQNTDMNRDHLYVQSKEIETIHHIYNLFLPEVAIDGHEFNATTTGTSSTLDDVQVGAAGSLNSSAAVNEMAQDMVHNAFEAASAQNLRPYNYGSYASTVNNAIGRAYYGLYGSLSFLIETRGIGTGLSFFERRVLSQYVVVESLIDYVAAHADDVRRAVAEGRNSLIQNGGLYQEDDLVVLTHSASKTNGYIISRPTWNLGDGTPVNANASGTIYRYDIAERSRPRPTAYVIPKGEAWSDTVAELMTKNGVSWYELEANSAAMLQQYVGSSNEAQLTAERAVVFPEGAYVFPMNQTGANVLAMTMEPDVTDSEGYNGTLLQSGLVSPVSGVIPIYRCCADLTPEGKIELVQLPDAPDGLRVTQPEQELGTGTITGLDAGKTYEYREESDSAYTSVPAGTTEIPGLDIGVYYVRYAAGPDQLASADCRLEVINRHITHYTIYVNGVSGTNSANGRTAETPVQTLDSAYLKLGKLMRNAPDGTQGSIVFTGNVTFNGDTELPTHDYPVLLTSATGTEGIVSQFNFGFHGDTHLEHMSITLDTAKLRYIAANGNRVVFGEDLTCNPSGSYFFNVAGGGRATAVTEGTNLTIQSGSWRNVYAAGYTGSTTGDVHLTLSGGTVTAVVQTSYSGTTTGNVTMNLSGASIGGNIYGGNTSSKNVTGNVTITLGEGLQHGPVYGGSRDSGNVSGTATIIVDGADVNASLNGGCLEPGNKVGESLIVLKRGALNGGTLQADTIRLDTSDGGLFRFNQDLSVDEVTGGGTAAWPAGKVLTVTTDKITGSTNVVLDNIQEDTFYICTPTGVAPSAFSYSGGKTFDPRAEQETLRWYLKDAEPVPVPVTGLTVKVNGTPVNENTILKVYTNESHPNHSLTLSAEVEPENASNQNVNWTRAETDGKVTLSRSGNQFTVTAVPDATGTNVGPLTLEIAAEENQTVKQRITVQVFRALENDVAIRNTTPAFGQTLEADIEQLEMTRAGKDKLSYQWKRGAEPIPGATGKTYTLTEADIGAQLSVDVTADPSTYYEGTRSAACAQAVEKAEGPSVPSQTIFGVKPTIASNQDGKLTGFGPDYAKYEYKAQTASNWTPVASEEVTGLPNGEYQVRISETSTHKAGAPVQVTVPAYDQDFHKINLAPDLKNGVIECSAVQAGKGTSITLTLKPDAGYELDTLTVTQANGSPVDLAGTGNVRTFSMPDEDVTVHATFKAIQTAKTYTVTYALTNLKAEGPASVEEGKAYTGKLQVESSSYRLPSSISITMNGQSFSDFEYDSSEGNITIPEGKITGDLILTASGVLRSSGGSHSSGSSSTTTTTTTKNPDGSTTTTTENKTTGTVTETTKYPDGSQTKVETQKDGSSVTTITQKNGASATVKTDAEGKMTAEVKLPASAVSAAQKENQTILLPVPEVEPAKDAETAPAVTVKTGSKTPVKVEIPASTTPGTVALLVKDDGSAEILKTSQITDTGLAVEVSDGTTVKLLDNSRRFADVSAQHWADRAITFVTARELFSGTSEDTFHPDAPMTRAMLVTVLARLNGAEIDGGATWYEKSMAWAVANGVSDGSNPDGNITREQLATMLWRYAGSPSIDEDLSRFPDAAQISSYAKEAIQWTVSQGILSGYDNGQLGPQGQATRAQVAQMLKNFLET